MDGWKSRSGRGSVAFDCDDSMTNGSSGDGFERDIIMEFVMQEEMENQTKNMTQNFETWTISYLTRIIEVLFSLHSIHFYYLASVTRFFTPFHDFMIIHLDS